MKSTEYSELTRFKFVLWKFFVRLGVVFQETFYFVSFPFGFPMHVLQSVLMRVDTDFTSDETRHTVFLGIRILCQTATDSLSLLVILWRLEQMLL